MNILKSRQVIINILEYILAFFIILDCNSIWQNSLENNKFKIIVIITTIVLLILLVAQIGIKTEIMQKYMLCVLVLFLYLGIFAVFSVSSHRVSLYFGEFYIFFPIIILCITIYSSINKIFQLYYRISDIMIFLAIISLVLWLLCSIFKIIPFNCTASINWGGSRTIRGFYNLYYETQSSMFGKYEIIRNTSIFTEGPMFSLFLSISLLIELFLKEKINIKRIVILVMAILSTFSTSGYIILAMCILGKIINNKSKKNKFIKIIKLLVEIVSVFFIAYICISIFKDKMYTNSYNVRLSYYIEELSIWKANILFGSGFGNNESGSSNSIGVILADGGIWLIALYIISFLNLIFVRKNYRLMLFSIGIVWLTITTVFPYSLILIMLLAMSYSFMLNKDYKIEGDYINV